MLKKIPQPLTILMLIIVLAAGLTWLLPAGKYQTLAYNENKSFTLTKKDGDATVAFSQHTLDSLHIRVKPQSFVNGDVRKPVSVPGTYELLPQKGQGAVAVIEAPLKGVYDAIDIILFLLVMGGFIQVFYATGAMEKGLASLSHKMNGREGWLIIILTFLLCFGGASYGMAEEGLAFYPILIPLFLAAGYDRLVPVAVIFGGTQIGTLSSFSNPFSTIIASNAAGINWTDGLAARLAIFVVSVAFFIGYIVRYAQKVKRDPSASFVYRYASGVQQDFHVNTSQGPVILDRRTNLLLLIFLATFLIMIGGVIFLHWWLLEMSSVFLLSAIVIAVITRTGEQKFLLHFIKGAEGMIGVTLIIGVARGVTIILNEGTISDTIIYHAASVAGAMPAGLFIVALMLMYMIFTLFISSTSGMAVVTMPIMGSLALLVGVPGREIINSYLFGMGIMGLITPTGLILPSLALANVTFKAWVKFIWPVMLILFIICSVFLIVGIQR